MADDPSDAPASIGWRLRADLHFQPTATAGRYEVRVDSERFEVGEEERFLCQILQRTTDPLTIQADFAQRFGLTLTAEQLAQFYQEMAELGLLEPVIEASTSAADVDSLDDDDRPDLPYRWTLLNPQRSFNRLAVWLKSWRYGVWLLIPGVPLALLVVLYNPQAYRHALQSLTDPGWHLLFKLVFGLFVINLSSKIVQGVTCAYYHGQVAQFGVRLAYGLIPRFFVAKRVRGFSRSQRLWVAAAALLTKLSLFVSGTLVWRLTLESGGSLGAYSFVLGHMALGAFLFTANPLWRADGYAWLVAFLDQPRLRERAFQVLGLYLRGRRPPPGLIAREKYGLLGYALACSAFLLLLVSLVLWALAMRLEARFQGVGVVLFLVILTLATRWALSRWSRQKPRRNGTASRAMTDHASALTASPPVAAKPLPKKTGGLMLIVLALLIGAAFLPYAYEVTGEVTLFPIARAEVHAVTAGIVTQVLVRENDWVTPEQVLAELSVWQQDYELAVTNANLERQQAELALLQHGAKAEAIDTVQQQLAMARIRAMHSRKARELLEPAHRQGVVKDLEYAEAVKTAEVDQAAVAVAEANVKLMKSPPLTMEITAKQAELKQLREQLTYLQNQRERTRLRSPVAGRIVTPRLDFKTGSYLKEGELFVVVEDHRVMQAEILAPETDIGEVALDAAVQLRVWAYPLHDFTGRVAAIAPVVELNPDNPFVRAVRVTIEIPNPDGLLKSQMTGFAKIAATDKPLMMAFSRALLRFVMLEMWSWLP